MHLDKLLVSLAQGDKSAFQGIYEQTNKTVYYIALSVMRERALAEDVMQSAFLKVIERAGQYQAGTNAQAWIYRIARNEALNLKKKRARETSVDEYENLAMFGTEEQSEYGVLTEIAKNTLEEEDFLILILVAVQGYKRREIAEMLSLPIATVTWKYGRAVKLMKDALKKCEAR